MVKAKRRFVSTAKPNGILHPRVQRVGPEHFGIVCVDPAKVRSTWLLCNFYGQVLIPPTEVNHNCGDLGSAVSRIKQAMSEHKLLDLTVAIERTGRYHLQAKRVFETNFEVRMLHPFTTKQYRLPANPGNKTDGNDLFAMQRATANGFGLLEPALDTTYQTLRLLARHRRDVVKKSSTLCCQLHDHLMLFLPGLEQCVEHLWDSELALWLAQHFTSPQALARTSLEELEQALRQDHIRFQHRSLDKFFGWAAAASEPDSQAVLHQQIFKDLEADRRAKQLLIEGLEIKIAAWLVRTPYIRLLVIPGVNVVSAADLGGEMGPIQHYAGPTSITGRAGLFPSRYQSDKVDLANGPLVRCANRRLRAAIMMIADNLIACNKHFRQLAAGWEINGKDAKRSRVKVASRFCRIVYCLLAGQQDFQHPSMRERDYVLAKLCDFHLLHNTPVEQIHADLQAAVQQLPLAAYAAEAAALTEKQEQLSHARKGGPKRIGEFLPSVLASLLAGTVKSKVTGERVPG